MVFIRPTIVRDNEDVRMTTVQKYRYIRAQEIMRNETEQSAMDGFVSEVLGTLPPGS